MIILTNLLENPVKLFKKSPDVLPQTQPNFQTTPLQSLGSIEDPLKFEDFPFGPSLSRGPSFPGDLRFSRLNSLNVPPVPNSLESNFSQSKNFTRTWAKIISWFYALSKFST